MTKVVIDTNTFISALLSNGPSRSIVRAWIKDAFVLITSSELLGELIFVLNKPKFSEIKAAGVLLVFTIKKKAAFVTPTHSLTICRDAKDNKFLNCAMKADLLISGDGDILVLKDSNLFPIPILTSREFLGRLERE